MKTIKKEGISLIVLIITIIVTLILALAVILTIANNNPVDNASKVRFQSDLRTMQGEIEMYESDQKTEKLSRGENYVLPTVSGDEMVERYPSTKNYKDLVEVQEGELVLKDTSSDQEKEWANELGFKVLDEDVDVENP